jgi:hypothetical protein
VSSGGRSGLTAGYRQIIGISDGSHQHNLAADPDVRISSKTSKISNSIHRKGGIAISKGPAFINSRKRL